MSIQLETSDNNGCGCFTALLLFILLAVVALLASGCSSTKEVEHVYHRDTVYSNSVVHDSVDRWHTHYEYLRGDTLHMIDTFYRDRWHIAHDTAYKTVVEVQEREVEKVVEKRVTVWWPLWVALGLIGGVVGLCLLGRWWLCREERREEEEKDIE